jgi:hypothetical protein
LTAVNLGKTKKLFCVVSILALLLSCTVLTAQLRMAMTVANFTGAEAEELRRAVGRRRSWERMKNLEGKLRSGMTANGIDIATQETIIQNISSFALYGFPESHAASFALIAYASAYFKLKYLAAFPALFSITRRWDSIHPLCWSRTRSVMACG